MTQPHQFSDWQKRLLATLGVIFLIAGSISVFVNTNGLGSIGLIAGGAFFVLLAKTGSFYSLRAGDWALQMTDPNNVPAVARAVEVVDQEAEEAITQGNAVLAKDLEATSARLREIWKSLEGMRASTGSARTAGSSPDYTQTRRDVAVSTVTSAISRAGDRIGDPEIVRNQSRGEHRDMWDLDLMWKDPNCSLLIKVAHLGVELSHSSMVWEIRNSLDQISVAARPPARGLVILSPFVPYWGEEGIAEMQQMGNDYASRFDGFDFFAWDGLNIDLVYEAINSSRSIE